MTIQLYDLCFRDDIRVSPYCWRVKLYLKAKGLEFETVPVSFTDKDLLSPFDTDRVPVLKDGSHVVVDSERILFDLEKRYPANRLVADPNAFKFFSNWLDFAVYPFVAPFIIMDIYDCLEPRDREYFRETREKRFGKKLEEVAENREKHLPLLSKALRPVKKLLKESEFIGGEEPNASDMALFSVFQWARCSCPDDVLTDPADPVFLWRERMLDLFDGYARKAPRNG